MPYSRFLFIKSVRKYGEYFKLLGKIIISIAIFYFLLNNIYTNYSKIIKYKIIINWDYMVCSFILLIITLLMFPIIWQVLTLFYKCQLDPQLGITKRIKSDIGKYLPGRILGYGYLLIEYTKAGKSKSAFLMSSFYELIISTFSALFFFYIALSAGNIKYLNEYKPYFFLICLLSLLFLHPAILKSGNKIVQFFTGKKSGIKFLNYTKVLLIIFGYLIVWALIGIAFFIYSYSIIEIEFKYLVYFSASFAISTFSGLLAFFLPAGIGARESVLILLLTPVIGSAAAIVISLGSRIWMICGELVLFSIASLFDSSLIEFRKN